MQFSTGISSQNLICYHWLSVSGNSKIMHFGILINSLCRESRVQNMQVDLDFRRPFWSYIVILCRNRALCIHTHIIDKQGHIKHGSVFYLPRLFGYYQWVSNATFKVHVTTNIIISADADSLFHRVCSKPLRACQDDSHRVVYTSSSSHSHEYQLSSLWCEPRCDSWCSVSSDGLMSIHHITDRDRRLMSIHHITDRDSPYIGTVLLPSV